MKTKFIKKYFPYTGEQLHSHFAYEEYGILGNSIVAWIGPCDIPFEHMVDLEDVLAHSPIRGALMIHFIVEVFGQSLFSAVSLQRLLASIVRDEIESAAKSKASLRLRRDGDDVYWDDAKITISIASISPVSTQIHFGVNINNKDTPVKTAALDDFKINVHDFVKKILEKFSKEFESIEIATQKVKPLK